MILSFKTKRNVNGYCKFLAFDTGAEVYSTEYARVLDLAIAIEIKSGDMKELRAKLETLEFKRVDRVF